jgi:hypothetical protein
VIDADSGDLKIKRFDTQFRDKLVLERPAGFGTEAPDAFVGVVAGKRGQIHAGDCAEKPGGLPVFLYSAAGYESLSAAFDGTGIDADIFDPIEIQRDAAIGVERAAAQVGEGGIGGRKPILGGARKCSVEVSG